MNDRYVRALVLLAAAFLWTARAGAAELVMFERSGCSYCEQFNQRIAPVYPRTAEGRRVPLRRVDIHAPIPPDLDSIEIERITPVFVMIEHGREIGRIRGYPGEESFWALFAGLMEELNKTTAAAAN
jgi:hypothetical protein